jgi:hypothetical protein
MNNLIFQGDSMANRVINIWFNMTCVLALLALGRVFLPRCFWLLQQLGSSHG